MALIDSHYEVLGVHRGATRPEIKKAYRQKALKHHPDKDATEHATAFFQRIQEAYEVLGSARQRFLYDAGVHSFAADEPTRMRNESAKQRAAEDRDSRQAAMRERLIEACKSGATMEVMKLCRGCSPSDVNGVDELGWTPLMYAAEARSTQAVSLLILYKADVHVIGTGGWTPLMLAASSSQHALGNKVDASEACLSTLLKANANPNSKTSSGVSALLLATASGSPSLVQSLLDHAADANCADETGMTPLVLAADSGYLAIVNALLKSGASVDNADGVGRTPLIAAGALAHKDVVAALLGAGANPNATTTTMDGSSALLSVIEFLANERMHCLVDLSKKANAVDVINMLLAAQADPNLVVQGGRTPVEAAKTGCDEDVLLILLGGMVQFKTRPGISCAAAAA